MKGRRSGVAPQPSPTGGAVPASNPGGLETRPMGGTPDDTPRWADDAPRWRVGREAGRTIYQQLGPEPSDDDVLIGMMDTPELAYEAALSHNFRMGAGASLWRAFGFDDDEDEAAP